MTGVLNRLKGFVRQQGWRATPRRVWSEARNYLPVRMAILRGVRFDSIRALLDFAFGPGSLFIRPSQIRGEIEPVLKRVHACQPRSVLEIGTNNGGTLFLWSRVAAPNAQLISLDLPGGEFGGGYPVWRRPLYRRFALPGQRVHLVRENSHHPTSLEKVRSLLGRCPLDFLFIDGDHTYDGVKRDFEMYAPLVRPGGLIALHDIAEHDDRTCNVRRFWLELARTLQTEEFVAHPPAGWAGIGLVQM